jgi:hypothetical protein
VSGPRYPYNERGPPLRTSVWQFAKLMVSNWVGLATGSLASILLIFYEHAANKIVPFHILVAFIALFLPIASYQTWSKEKRDLDDERRAHNATKAAIAAPKLNLDYDCHVSRPWQNRGVRNCNFNITCGPGPEAYNVQIEPIRIEAGTPGLATTVRFDLVPQVARGDTVAVSPTVEGCSPLTTHDLESLLMRGWHGAPPTIAFPVSITYEDLYHRRFRISHEIIYNLFESTAQTFYRDFELLTHNATGEPQ